MYSTASCSPSSRARAADTTSAMCLPSDGPAPAEVTYERRPCASAIGVPSARHDRLAPERVALHAALDGGRRSSACRASRPARARGAARCASLPTKSSSFTFHHAMSASTTCSPRRARSRTRGTPSRAGRSCRRRRCRRERRRAAAPPPTPRPRASRPRSIGTYSSQPRSPTYEMRDARPPAVTSSVFHVANGKPSFETSSLVIDERMSRDRGPQRPSVHSAEVWSSMRASRRRWSANHFLSAIPCAPPVTTRKRSSSIFMIVRSDLKPPPGASTGV